MPAIFRNYLVFANNKRQNIESRLFATGSGFRTGSVAISYNSFFNKFISDLPTLSNRLSPKYYVSESVAASSTTNIVYQNNRNIYLQNFDIFIQETGNSIERQSDTGSFSILLKTKYYASESVAASSTTNLIYQNNRSIYLQNLDVFIQETGNSIERQSDTGSFSTLLKTKYFLSDSNGSGDSIIYQNNKAIYLQNLDIFVTEASPPITRQNETGSSAIILNTKYTLADAVSTSSAQIGYQSDRAIYLENSDILIKEFTTPFSTNETGSNNLLLFTNYYMSQSNATGSTLAYQNFKYIYLEDDSYLLTE